MALRIRLCRTGKKNDPSHRVVVTPQNSPRDGRFVECLGHYDPKRKVESIDAARADYWIRCGAQPTPTVDAILKRARAGVSLAAKKSTTPRKKHSKHEKPAAEGEAKA